MKADAFLTSLGKDDGDDVPRKRRARKTAEAAPAAADPTEAPAQEAPAPAPEAASAPPAAVPDPDPAPAEPTPSQRRAAERRTVIEPDALEGIPPEVSALIQTVQEALLPQAGRGQPSSEPNWKTSVDIRWTIKQALADLVTRDKRGPKAEINDALELWLRIKGIDVPKWNG